jgi:TFIIF-interacting CTD phosphatase-like protein
MNDGTLQRKLLILDLDETLLFATEERLNIQEDFMVGEYYVYLRPYLKRFLAYCRNNFEVAVWTSSSEDYAVEICRQIFPSLSVILFLWSRKRCTRCVDYETGEIYWVKDLKKVRRKGYALEQIIVVDDTARKLNRNYGNLICMKEFLGDQQDKELLLLEAYLEILNPEPDIRKLEKRNWRAKIKLKDDRQ